MASYGESSAKDLVARFIESIGVRDEQGIVPFVRSWPQIVGKDLAAHSQVLDVRNNAILVGLDHPAWLQRMHMDQDRIIRLIQREFPTLGVRYLHLTVVDQLDPSIRMRQSHQDENESDIKSTKPKDVPSTETGGENGPGHIATRASEDDDFVRRLRRLEEAIKRKNGDVD